MIACCSLLLAYWVYAWYFFRTRAIRNQAYRENILHVCRTHHTETLFNRCTTQTTWTIERSCPHRVCVCWRKQAPVVWRCRSRARYSSFAAYCSDVAPVDLASAPAAWRRAAHWRGTAARGCALTSPRSHTTEGCKLHRWIKQCTLVEHIHPNTLWTALL